MCTQGNANTYNPLHYMVLAALARLGSGPAPRYAVPEGELCSLLLLVVKLITMEEIDY